MVIALNQVDLMEKNGLSVDAKKFEEILGVLVVITIAIKGKGIKKLIDKIIDATENKKISKQNQIWPRSGTAHREVHLSNGQCNADCQVK